MTPAPISVERLRELLAKATPGPWQADPIDNEGGYGSGPNPRTGFKSFAIYDERGLVIMDSLNSEVAMVEEDSGDRIYAWDDVALNNANLIVAAVNALPALLHQLAERDAEVERLRRECDLRKHAVDRWMPCPDHRDKVDGRCQVCAKEAAERAKEALGQSIRDAQAAVCTSMAAFNMTGAVFVADPKLAERMAADSLLWQARAARAHAIPSISNCLEYGRTFLQRSHLRSVRNLSLLIAAGQNTVIEDLLSKLSPNEKAPCYEIIKAWITEDSSALRIAGAEWEKYKEWINREEPDDFAGCYFFDGGISGKGLQLRLETRVCKNAK